MASPFKGVDVTARLIIEAPEGANNEDLADELCLILSAFSGQRVNWIAKESPEGCVLAPRVTIPGGGPPVATTKDWTYQQLLNAAVNALPAFRLNVAKKKYRLQPALINLWLDARMDSGFLETRGIKTAVVLESINADYKGRHKPTGKGANSFRNLQNSVHNDVKLPFPCNIGSVKTTRDELIHQGKFPKNEDSYKSLIELTTFTDELMLALVGLP